ncbi:hypothetical protein HNQ51_001757 [Inhella inkyongensis]|uniref:Uncharacterized protein n=1 Tax=Inhella inkyongensis TaxID=392593 RepID=A0A840S3Z7_9BURK|nr:hypothetical protein [Inhella inkyongensis]MBB5204443.1 hypothetical protein [Inhella inkyongensis]
MKEWIVTRTADSKIVYRYQAEAVVEWAGFEFATHTHAEVPAEPAPPAAPLEPIKITRRAFWGRLPKANLWAMQSILRSGAPSLLAGRLGIHQVLVSDGPFVDLRDADTISGIGDLMSENFPLTVTLDGVTLPLRLNHEQGAAVLSEQVAEREVYRG